MRTSIVGTKLEWRGQAAMEALATLQGGTYVTLRREPNNEHDANAVSVWLGEHCLGYIPKAHNPELARVLDAEPDSLRAEITHEAIFHNGIVRFAPRILISDKEPTF